MVMREDPHVYLHNLRLKFSPKPACTWHKHFSKGHELVEIHDHHRRCQTFITDEKKHAVRVLLEED